MFRWFWHYSISLINSERVSNIFLDVLGINLVLFENDVRNISKIYLIDCSYLNYIWLFLFFCPVLFWGMEFSSEDVQTHPKIDLKLSPNHPKTIPNISRNYPRFVPKWFEHCPKLFPKLSQNYQKIMNFIPDHVKFHPKVLSFIPEWSIFIPELPKFIPEWSNFIPEFLNFIPKL